MKRILCKADIALFIIIVVIAVAGIVWMSGAGSAKTAIIRVDGEVYQQVSLSVDQTIVIGDVRIEVKAGAVAFVESDCPTQACVKTGWLSAPGASAACLPNRISITVTGDSGVDAVAE
ncbi:MAG: NusG domain II-containing protein [Eubacteriales bacterium]|nr:NusG domain II-containing protein [Eubacteriales bacterium]